MANPRLDRKRDYGESWGAAGHTGYVQDGLQFDMRGHLLPGEKGYVAPRPAGRPPNSVRLAAAEPDAEAEEEEAAAPEPAAEASNLPDEVDYDELDDDEIRTLVEVNGETFTTRAAAIALLKGATA